MVTKIARNKCLLLYPSFPQSAYNPVDDEIEMLEPRTYDKYILTLATKSLKGHIKKLSEELYSLAKKLSFEKLIFLGDSRNYWLTKSSLSRNDYPPLAEAINYLQNNEIGKRFNGALEVYLEDLPVFTKHLFCLIRCDPTLPYLNFIDPAQNVLGTICQYGNIHFYTLKQQISSTVSDAIKATNFKVVSGTRCFSPFSKSGKISERRIIL